MIRSVLGSWASIGGVLGSGRGGAAAWYLAGGVSAANCVAAYQPIGAASLAASYDNIAAPGNGLPDGTYDAAPGVAPTWAAATGWAFDNSHYLRTGITPVSGWSAIVRFSDVVSTHNGAAFGGSGFNNSRFSIIPSTSGAVVSYASGSFSTASPELLAGTLGIAGQQGYRNGSADGGAITAWSADASYAIYIGARNALGNLILLFRGKIQALAIYDATLSAAQVAAISSAMSAL